jgi:hypothetical protein
LWDEPAAVFDFSEMQNNVTENSAHEEMLEEVDCEVPVNAQCVPESDKANTLGDMYDSLESIEIPEEINATLDDLIVNLL